MRGGETTRANRYSSLAKRAYNALSPVSLRKSHQRTSVQPTTSKYHYLAAQSNHNQQIIKEIIGTERKYTQTWKAQGYGNTEPFHTTYGSTHSGFGMSPNLQASPGGFGSSSGLGNFSRSMNNSSVNKNPFSVSSSYFSKSHVRNNTFDPILGFEKEYKPPVGVFRALGSNHADLYRFSGLHRSPSINQFQSSLRSRT